MKPEDLQTIQPYNALNGRFYPIPVEQERAGRAIERIRQDTRNGVQEVIQCRSVTDCLKSFPRPQLEEWFKKTGLWADEIAHERAKIGSSVDRATTRLDLGDELRRKDFSHEIWRGICAYQNFVQKHAHEVLAIQPTVYDLENRIAGTADRVIQMGDDLGPLDIKFTSGLYETHDIQVQVYARLMEIMGIKGVNKAWLLNLNSRTKQGFTLRTMDYDPEIYDTTFAAVQHLHEVLHGTEPRTMDDLPETVQLD